MGIKDSSLWAREILSFLETAKNGSINGTAEANAMKQSNLSRTLKSLEEKLKCQLLERGYNGVRLTENGREVFKVACDLDKVIYKVKNFTISDKNVSGKIRLWTSDGLGTGYLSNCLSEFIAKYPDVKIDVVCSLDTPGSFSTTDMAVVYEEPEFDDGEIVSCYELQFGLFASMSYLSKFGYPNNIKDLQENHRICDRENYAGVWPQWKKIIDGARHVVATTNSSAMLLRMTCDGIGIGLHPIAIGKRERDLIHLSQLGIVYGMCKQELLPRWQQCGYHEIPGAERIEQNGMVLIPISLDLKENPQAIKMTSHPSLLTALEGHWHEKMQEVRKSSMMKAIFWKLKKIRQEHFNL